MGSPVWVVSGCEQVRPQKGGEALALLDFVCLLGLERPFYSGNLLKSCFSFSFSYFQRAEANGRVVFEVCEANRPESKRVGKFQRTRVPGRVLRVYYRLVLRTHDSAESTWTCFVGLVAILVENTRCLVTFLGQSTSGSEKWQGGLCVVHFQPSFYDWDSGLIIGVSSPFFSAVVLSKTDRHFPRVFGSCLERSGSVERMETEATPRIISGVPCNLFWDKPLNRPGPRSTVVSIEPYP